MRDITRHFARPDYSKPLLELTPAQRDRLWLQLAKIYDRKTADDTMPELERIMKVYYACKPKGLREHDAKFSPEKRFSERDLMLITYGDLLKGEGETPLETLNIFLHRWKVLRKIVSIIHLLPFFPYSSDRGFSVMNYRAVDPRLGSWGDISALDEKFKLMFDGVLNHVSSHSMVFQRFLDDHPANRDFFVSYDSPDEISMDDLSKIFRPRLSDILTRFYSIKGPKYVWTTFSSDQVDLNYKNPGVLLAAVEILLFYVRQGADLIRLDAVTFLWSELGTSCANLWETHEIVKFFRAVLDMVAPWTILVTETNVPHRENVEYFGNGYNEAQLVYNFTLPPLVLYTIYKEDSSMLTRWASGLEYPSPAATFLNILDTHDGIGLMGVKELLGEDDIFYMIECAKERGALVSFRTGEKNIKEPYEINSTWFSAINGRMEQDPEGLRFQVRRYVASRAIQLVLKGVPAIYFHGLVGSENDVAAAIESHSRRDINRMSIEAHEIMRQLGQPFSRIRMLRDEFGPMLLQRVRRKAFHPSGRQKIWDCGSRLFVVMRSSVDGSEHVLCIINISSGECGINITSEMLDFIENGWQDLFSDVSFVNDGTGFEIKLSPYQVMWLVPSRNRHDDL
jgi:sucrose phosphorylase